MNLSEDFVSVENLKVKSDSLKVNNYVSIYPSNSHIIYTGRFLKTYNPEKAIEKVEFDWPHSSIEVKVSNTSWLAIRLQGHGNYFNVFLNGNFHCVCGSTKKHSITPLIDNLDPSRTHHFKIIKRNEPQMRGIFASFKVASFHGFVLESGGKCLPIDTDKSCKIEFIGDSDTCAFGNEGRGCCSLNFLHMKGRCENVYNGFASIVGRKFNSDFHVLAWSGKGIHSNSVDWGPTMKSLWKRTIASRKGNWDLQSWVPDAVVIFLGGNDIFPPSSRQEQIVNEYTALLEEVRTHRPNAHIFCIVCDEGCISSVDSEKKRKKVSDRLQRVTEEAIQGMKSQDKVHYTLIEIPGGFGPEDYANMMHYSVSGHKKFADVLANSISSITGWNIASDLDVTPFPALKQNIFHGGKNDRSSCTIS